MYKIIAIQSFWDDLEEIADNLEEYTGQPDVADKLLLEIERLSEGLKDFPRRYRKHIPGPRHTLKDQHRVMTIKGYYVFYVIFDEEKTIELRRMINRSKDIDKWL